MPPYFYPSFFAIALEPLTFLPCSEAAVVWFVLSAGMWVAATLLLADMLARRWPGRRLEATALVVALSALFRQGYPGMSLGQVHALVLLGFALAFWLVDRDHPWQAGGALAVITVIKVLPALLIIYLPVSTAIAADQWSAHGGIRPPYLNGNRHWPRHSVP